MLVDLWLDWWICGKITKKIDNLDRYYLNWPISTSNSWILFRYTLNGNLEITLVILCYCCMEKVILVDKANKFEVLRIMTTRLYSMVLKSANWLPDKRCFVSENNCFFIISSVLLPSSVDYTHSPVFSSPHSDCLICFLLIVCTKHYLRRADCKFSNERNLSKS